MNGTCFSSLIGNYFHEDPINFQHRKMIVKIKALPFYVSYEKSKPIEIHTFCYGYKNLEKSPNFFELTKEHQIKSRDFVNYLWPSKLSEILN